MQKCVFKVSEIKKIVEHALAAPQHRQSWHGDEKAAILFVHDQGVYCMSNGLPGLVGENGKNFVAYAENCNPEVDADWWENSRRLVGGDDFAEVFNVNPSWLENCDAADKFCLQVTEKEIAIEWHVPVNSTKKVAS